VRTARLHAPLTMEDRIRTGAGASCLVIIGDVGLVELGEKSEARLGDLRQVQSQDAVRDVVTTHLSRGIRRQSFIHVPAGWASIGVHAARRGLRVRGTCFEMDLTSRRRTQCTVLDGELELTGTAAGREWSRTVTSGKTLEVTEGQVPPEPSDATPAALQKLWPVLAAAQQDSALPVVPSCGRARSWPGRPAGDAVPDRGCDREDGHRPDARLHRAAPSTPVGPFAACARRDAGESRRGGVRVPPRVPPAWPSGTCRVDEPRASTSVAGEDERPGRWPSSRSHPRSGTHLRAGRTWP